MENININLNYTFRHTETSDPIKEYCDEKIGAVLKKFVHQDIDAHIVFEVQKKRQIAEISFNSFGTNFTCTEESDNMYKSIDALSQVLAKQLRRHKEKAASHL